MDDFLLDPKEKKSFVLYYPIINGEENGGLKSCITFPNSLFFDKYNEKLKNGTFYYEILEWEAEKWNSLILEH